MLKEVHLISNNSLRIYVAVADELVNNVSEYRRPAVTHRNSISSSLILSGIDLAVYSA